MLEHAFTHSHAKYNILAVTLILCMLEIETNAESSNCEEWRDDGNTETERKKYREREREGRRRKKWTKLPAAKVSSKKKCRPL